MVSRARRRGGGRGAAPTVVIHWLVALPLALSAATGLRLSSDAPEAIWSWMLGPVLPQGDVITWHLVSASALTILAAPTSCSCAARAPQPVIERPSAGSRGIPSGNDPPHVDVSD